MKRLTPNDMRLKPVFNGDDADRNLFIYMARRLRGWRIEVIALGEGLSSMRIIQIIAKGDRLLRELRELHGADEVIIYPFEKA